MGKEPKSSGNPAETIKEGLIDTVKKLRDQYPDLIAEIENLPNGSVETVADLESFFPALVDEIKNAVVVDLGQATAAQVEKKLPELYERITATVQGRLGPDLKAPGFLLEHDDPFADATVTYYQNLKGTSDMRLPCVLPSKDKANGAIHTEAWKKKFEKTEALEVQFKTVKAYIAYKSRRIVQALEYYVLMAEGAGDNSRAAAAHKALNKLQ